VDNEWVVGPKTDARRHEFVKNLLEKLEVGGYLIITCPNGVYPVDFAHGHPYIPFAIEFHRVFKFSPTIPWSKKNFLPTIGKLNKMIKASGFDCETKYLSDLNYFSFSRSGKSVIRRLPIFFYLSFVWISKYIPVSSPHIVSVIRKKS